MYVLCDCADIYSLNSKKKEKLRNFFELRKIFFNRIGMHNFVWFKEILFELKKLFSGCKINKVN